MNVETRQPNKTPVSRLRIFYKADALFFTGVLACEIRTLCAFHYGDDVKSLIAWSSSTILLALLWVVILCFRNLRNESDFQRKVVTLPSEVVEKLLKMLER